MVIFYINPIRVGAQKKKLINKIKPFCFNVLTRTNGNCNTTSRRVNIFTTRNGAREYTSVDELTRTQQQIIYRLGTICNFRLDEFSWLLVFFHSILPNDSSRSTRNQSTTEITPVRVVEEKKNDKTTTMLQIRPRAISLFHVSIITVVRYRSVNIRLCPI